MKIGIDTNVLVRWLVADGSPDELSRAAAVMAQDGLHLSSIAASETAWVLTRIYKFQRNDVSAAMYSLLELSNLTIGGATELREALAEFERHRGDFNDHLIAAHDHSAGCEHTLTFDRKAARSRRFKLA